MTFWTDEATVAKLKKIGKRQDRSVGWLIRKFVNEAVKREENKS
jgi:predicted transcriptional regulator